jgi:hypothetical protein
MSGTTTAGSGLVVVIRGFNASLPTVSTVRSNKDGTTNFSVAVAIVAESSHDYIAMYYLPNTAGGSALTCTVTMSASTSEIRAVAYVVTGVPTDSTFFQGGNSATGASGATINPSTVSGGVSTEAVFEVCSTGDSAADTLTTTGTGWTRGGEVTNGASAVFGAQEFKASALLHSTTISGGWTQGTTSDPWAAGIAAFNATGAATTAMPPFRRPYRFFRRKY